jgi:hypothetical protein
MYKSQDAWALFCEEDPDAVRQLAQDPSTSPEILAEMVELWLPCDGLQVLLVQNPNTPIEALKILAHRYPAEFFQNPILPLLFLENPARLTEFSVYDLCSDDHAPAFFLLSLAALQDKYTRLLIALHPNTPPATRLMLLQSEDASVQGAAALAIVAFRQLDWDSLSGHHLPDVCQLLAKHPECSVELLMNLAVHSEAQVRAAVAANPNTPKSVLEILALDPEASVRLVVAQNLSTPTSLIERLQKDSAKEVACAARAFPESFAGLRGSCKELGRSQFSASHIFEELRQLLVNSSQYGDSDYCCMWHHPLWRDYELEHGDNSLDPRDIASNQLHRKRGPKPDSWSRTKNSWPCAIRRGKVSFRLYR